ncbi:MAG: ABC transporter ATP-binding protein [Alphaproteobacteria bacterium]|nr:ABC transporter ATP-binding protein [Alphaproteobacteria bacterium]
MGELRLVDLEKSYDRTPVVRGMNLAIGRGEFVSLLGPSGCGKTTTLRMIAGFVAPGAGRIELDGKRIDSEPPWRREIGMVFQNYALFPHLTAAGNVAFGLRMRHLERATVARKVEDALGLVGLAGLGERYPSQLSGGQQQRVALARALVIEPRLLLLDEPLSNLDARLRAEVREEIARLQRRLGITTLFVTHDQEEALALSDRVVVMNRGETVEVADPRTLSEHPRRLFSATFLGSRSVFAGEARDGRFHAPGLPPVTLTADDPPRASHLVLRSARLRLAAGAVGGDADGGLSVPGTLAAATYLGDSVACEVALTDGARIAVVRPSGESIPAVGAAVRLLAGRDAIALIDDSNPNPGGTP